MFRAVLRKVLYILSLDINTFQYLIYLQFKTSLLKKCLAQKTVAVLLLDQNESLINNGTKMDNLKLVYHARFERSSFQKKSHVIR